MNYMKWILLTAGLSIILAVNIFAQENVIMPDLTKIVSGDGWRVVNREPEMVTENGQSCVHFKAENETGGIAWLENVDFNNGIIEADLKGRNARGRSFLGIAFRGVNDSTYDVVYFRPFNFVPEANVKGHSVQYISHPKYTWFKLREEHPGEFENSIVPPPNPDQFFHVKIVIEKPKIKVYVDQQEEPSLVVDELSDRTGGKIGLWMDYVTEGMFANLKILQAEE